MEYATYLKALNGRLEQNETKRELLRQIKRIEGEELIKQILDQELMLNYVHDIELDINNKVKIDFLIVDDEKIMNLEIKHYKGDYYIIDNQLKNSYGNIFQTPFQQMKRAEFELELMKSKLDVNGTAQPQPTTTNPTFT